jgi:hypothetical protein
MLTRSGIPTIQTYISGLIFSTSSAEPPESILGVECRSGSPLSLFSGESAVVALLWCVAKLDMTPVPGSVKRSERSAPVLATE